MSDSKNEKMVTARGVITEALPSTLFRVKLPARSHDGSGVGREEKGKGENEEQPEILAYLSGKMRMHRIKVLIGDSVEVVLDSYGGKGRIVKRL